MTDHEDPTTLLARAAELLREAHQPCGPIPIQLHTTHMIGFAQANATIAVGHLLGRILTHLENRVTDTPGTDWEARHAAAGQTATRPQHEAWTFRDGVSVNPRHGHITDTEVFDLIEGNPQ